VVDVWPDEAVVHVSDTGKLLLAQGRDLGCSGVAAGLSDASGARDDGGHTRLVNDPARGELRHRHFRWHERGKLPNGREANFVRHTGERLTNVERLTVLVERPVVVGREVVVSSYFPDSKPDARGTRAMMPTPASRAAGSTSSSGRCRKQLRMICMLAGRCQPMPVIARKAISPAAS
jgi:hypothetical protein